MLSALTRLFELRITKEWDGWYMCPSYREVTLKFSL
jgi:hypothetical protein